MSELQVTPGDWRIIEKENTAGWGLCVGTRETIICRVTQRNKDNKRANANLIAAAPELYDALRELLSRVANDKDCHAYWCDAQEQAIKALAKARGEL
jgi:hypothetical protein